MLHSKDRYLLIDIIIPWLVEEGYVTITYRDFLDQLEGETVPYPRQVLLSIDDINPDYINPYFVAMVGVLHEQGMVATLGVNPTVSVESAPDAYELLRLWADWGMELASHTVDHAYLPGQDDEFIGFQLAESVSRIELGTGQRPITLILPYGAIASGDSVVDEQITSLATVNGYRFVVGIVGGHSVTWSDEVMYVGRLGTETAIYNLETWWCR